MDGKRTSNCPFEFQEIGKYYITYRLRVHRTYMVAFNTPESINKNQIKIQDKTIPVGESYRISFRKIINE